MKKIYLQKITQHNTESFIGKVDPRDLVKIAEEVEMGEVQDAQRPLNAKRVKDIANYVSDEKGIIGNISYPKQELNIIRIVEAYQNETPRNPHLVNPNYLKLPQALEEKHD